MNICPARHASTFCVPTSIPPGHLCAFTCVSLVPKLTHLPTIIFDTSSPAASLPSTKHQARHQRPACTVNAGSSVRKQTTSLSSLPCPFHSSSLSPQRSFLKRPFSSPSDLLTTSLPFHPFQNRTLPPYSPFHIFPFASTTARSTYQPCPPIARTLGGRRPWVWAPPAPATRRCASACSTRQPPCQSPTYASK